MKNDSLEHSHAYTNVSAHMHPTDDNGQRTLEITYREYVRSLVCTGKWEFMSTQTLKDSPGKAGHLWHPWLQVLSCSWHLLSCHRLIWATRTPNSCYGIRVWLVSQNELKSALFFFLFLEESNTKLTLLFLLKSLEESTKDTVGVGFLWVCVIRLYSYVCLFETTSCHALVALELTVLS